MKHNTLTNIAIVSSSFWPEITNSLEEHCIKALRSKGITSKQIDIFHVPGSLEIPLIVKKLAQKKKYNAFIVFGVIHKGKTYHFEMIANECIRGCMDVSLAFEVPIIFEVLAVFNIQDAIERSKGTTDNRGIEAANAALSMIDLLTKL